MKIYTKAGDDGSTGLIGGQRVPKSDARIECVGAVDELNAAIGWAAVTAGGPVEELAVKLRSVQNELFIADLAVQHGEVTQSAGIARICFC